MKGTYNVRFPRDSFSNCYRQDRDPQFDRAWHLFVSTCRSLHADGLHYGVQFNMAGDSDVISQAMCQLTIKAHGQRHAKRARQALRVHVNTAPLTIERIQRSRCQADRELVQLRAHFQRHVSEWKQEGYRPAQPDSALKTRRLLVGRVLGLIQAQRKVVRLDHCQPNRAEYALLDRAMGCRVTRESELDSRSKDKGYFRWFIGNYACTWRNPWGAERKRDYAAKAPTDADVTIARQLEEARADIEYWRELEILSGQRQRFKPGKAEAVDVLDDEIAA